MREKQRFDIGLFVRERIDVLQITICWSDWERNKFDLIYQATFYF